MSYLSRLLTLVSSTAVLVALISFLFPTLLNHSSNVNTNSDGSPVVSTQSATFVGLNAGRLSKYLGIPYAKPPISDARLRIAQPVDEYAGTVKADSFGPACSQQARRFPLPEGLEQGVLDIIANLTSVPDLTSEDCLSLNIITPTNANPGSKLPVLVWIHGGGFSLGSADRYDGTLVVERSIEIGVPIIYVSINYRLSALGFLASQEVKDAGIGNLGLRDQREALRWLRRYIAHFGGDPEKVTIWGESAGANSVAFQMLANNGETESLFRGAFMQSGAALPTGDITGGQVYYDALVRDTGCTGVGDTLTCLRGVEYDVFKKAMDNLPSLFSYRSVAVPWFPRADGDFIRDFPQRLVHDGKIANIPFVSGGCDDEGTMFSFANLNVTTSDAFREYIKYHWFPHASEEELDQVLSLYPADITQGSPYGTGTLYALTSQYKRLASFQGDVAFQAPRRFFVKQLADKHNVWAYLNQRLKITPILGSFHMTDLFGTFGGGELTDYIIYFTATLNPNAPAKGKSPRLPHWPKYNTSNPGLLTFYDTGFFPSTAITEDRFREEGIEVLGRLLFEHPL